MPDIELQKIKKILDEVCDPEIPVLTIADLGIIRDVKINQGEVEVIITPTYTGCPAMDMIAASIKMELMARGFADVLVKFVISPAWTTDWMTEKLNSGMFRTVSLRISSSIILTRL